MIINPSKSAFIFVLISLLFWSGTSEASNGDNHNETIRLNDDTDMIVLDDAIEILVDHNQTYDLKDIVSGDVKAQFVPYKKMGRPNFGYTQANFWIRFQVNDHASDKDWLLEVDTPKLNRIHLYKPKESGKFVETLIGNKDSFKEREIFHRNFLFNLAPDTNVTKTYYLQLKSNGSMQIPLKIWDPAAFAVKSQTDYMLFGILIGIAVVMAFYNLFLFLSIRDHSYLYYVFFVVANFLLFLADSGLGFQFLWPEQVRWNLQAVVTFMSLDSLAALLFARRFLHTQQFSPKLDRLFKICMVVNALIVVWSFFSFTLAMYAALLGVAISIVLIVTASIKSLLQNYRPARFFSLAWGIFLIGASISTLVDAGMLPLTPLTKYAWQFSTTLEIILLSFALGDRYRIMRDEKEIAENKAIQNQQLALENLKKADQLKDEFLTITSHELRTPLAGIIGIADTLRSGVVGNITPELDRHLWMIIVSGRRLTRLVDDIIDFSRLKNNDIEIHTTPVHLFALTDVVLTICQPLIKDKPIVLRNEIDPSIPLVTADENRLQQILYNLIGNAIKYTREGEIIVSAKQQNNQVRISVSDTGGGIDPEQLDLIFEPFQQGDSSLARETGGSGIGLSITKRLVELHQGGITVESAVDRGSIFSFTLPITVNRNITENETASTIAPQYVAGDDVDTINITPETSSDTHYETSPILIADDEYVNLQVLTNQLSLEGYDVRTVTNGEAVLEALKKQSFGLIILDIMMPGLSGFEVCRRLREDFSLMELPILMLTAKHQMHDQLTALEVGANDYLTKPCDKRELLTRVQTLLKLSRINQQFLELNQQLEEKVNVRTQALQNANQRLEQANQALTKLSTSRRMLMANIAHELGNPVTVIQGYVQAIQDGLINDHDSWYSDMVNSKLNILNRLIADLSDLSKWEAGVMELNKESIQLDEWLDQLHIKYEWYVRHEERTFEFAKRQDSINFKQYECVIDTGRMDQMFSNIIQNAIKHTELGTGKVGLIATLKENDNLVLLQIYDNGRGINADQLPFIFERFYKAATQSSHTDGTGLGLAITKEIVGAHNGTIWAESVEGKGSMFSIQLPVRSIKKGRC